MQCAREALYSGGALRVGNTKRHTNGLVTDVAALADALDELEGAAAGRLSPPEPEPSTAADNPWKQTGTGDGYIHSMILNVELDAFDAPAEGHIETYPVGHRGVPLTVHVDVGDMITAATSVHLNAEQTEAFGYGLLEQAEAARQYREENNGDQ